MKHKKTLILLLLAVCILFCLSSTAFAAELTEAEVEQAVADQGEETVTGNIFIWFLCAIAFLKVSQKIDSFMASLGINVGNTGGNMMAELLIAGRSLSGALRGHGGGGGYRKASSPGSAAVGGSFLSGGLAGAVGRQMERSAVNAATGYSEGGSIGNSMYQSSLQKGGDFANRVIGDIAKGSYGQVGSITGDDAAKAYASYMGLRSSDTEGTSTSEPLPQYSNMEIGGGRITGTETTDGIAVTISFSFFKTRLIPSVFNCKLVKLELDINFTKLSICSKSVFSIIEPPIPHISLQGDLRYVLQNQGNSSAHN